MCAKILKASFTHSRSSELGYQKELGSSIEPNLYRPFDFRGSPPARLFYIYVLVLKFEQSLENLFRGRAPYVCPSLSLAFSQSLSVKVNDACGALYVEM